MPKTQNKLRGSYRNIAKILKGATPDAVFAGEAWYREANQVAQSVGEMAGYTDLKALQVGAGIIAALSPQMGWGLNITIAILLVKEGTRKATLDNHTKAVKILQGEEPLKVLGGEKVKAFYLAIVDPYNDSTEVVIERHAIAVYLGRAPKGDAELRMVDSPKVRNRIRGAYLKVSKDYNINHHLLQSITWNAWRMETKTESLGLVKNWKEYKVD